jgi:hypothetical protein
MAELNVFELTNQELHKSEKKSAPSAKVTKPAKKSVKESVKRMPKRIKGKKPFDIPANKLKFESISRFRTFLEGDGEGDEADVTADFTPEDDLVLVIDPEMDDVPEDVEEAEAAAEELIGNHVCKCSICGANYVTDEEISEELEIEDETCPVCGETGDQIVVGVITPMEELSAEDDAEVSGVDDEDGEDFEVEDEVDVEEEPEDEDDEDFGESVKRQRRRTMARRAESIKRRAASRKPARRVESTKRHLTRKPVAKKPTPVATAQFDEAVLNRMLTKFAKENYENVRSVRISKGTVRGKRLTLEGVVTTTKGIKRPIKFVSENFVPSTRMTISFKEIGPFTESIKNVRPTFVVECVMRNKTIIPAALKYSFKTKNASVKENNNTYEVKGKVMNESLTRTPAKKPARPARKPLTRESAKRPRRTRK